MSSLEVPTGIRADRFLDFIAITKVTGVAEISTVLPLAGKLGSNSVVLVYRESKSGHSPLPDPLSSEDHKLGTSHRQIDMLYPIGLIMRLPERNWTRLLYEPCARLGCALGFHLHYKYTQCVESSIRPSRDMMLVSVANDQIAARTTFLQGAFSKGFRQSILKGCKRSGWASKMNTGLVYSSLMSSFIKGGY